MVKVQVSSRMASINLAAVVNVDDDVGSTKVFRAGCVTNTCVGDIDRSVEATVICTVLALKESEGLRDARFVLAFPVSMLCVLSLLRGGGNIEQKFMLNVALIPYRALSYTLIFMAILWLLFFLFRSRIRRILEICDAPSKSKDEDIAQKQGTMTNQKKKLKDNRDETWS